MIRTWYPSWSRRVMAFAAIAIVAAGCSGERALLPVPQLAISDGAHGGNGHFYFLPPLMRQPFTTGTFDPSLEPVVRITEGGTVLAMLPATVDPAGELYQANWRTGDFALDPALTYRITVLVGTQELGFADVDVVRTGSELRNVNTGEYVGLVDGRTLPIKFRIEAGAIAVEPTLLVFSVQPSATAARTPIGPSVQVAVQGTSGLTATSSSANITLTITGGTGATGAVLGRTTTVSAVNGVATFNNLMIDREGTGYTLTAASAGLTGATSDTFSVTSLPGIIVFQNWPGSPANQFWRMNTDGTGLFQLTAYSAIGGLSNEYPDLSRDSSRITFSRNMDVVVMNADGTGSVTYLTTDGLASHDLWPRWSPDGSRIVWQRDDQVWTMNADGSGKVQLTSAGTNLHPSFSPDRTWIVFESTRDGSGVSELYRMASDGTGQTRLTANNAVGVSGGDMAGPHVSPDGTKIVFGTYRGGTLQVYVMNIDGTGQTPLATDATDPTWSPDGRAILFRTPWSGYGQIRVMSADGWAPRQLTALPEGSYYPSWR